MIALAGSGRQAEALRAYQDARRVLGEELGIEPAGELREVEERVLLQDPTLLEQSAAATAPASLPTRMSSFVGRATEIADLRAAVAEHRMVTVVGPPGMGKTRLAIEAGSREAAAGRRVWFAALSERNTRHEVVDAIAGAFGIEEREGRVDGSPEERIRDFVRRRQGLLILDNCEQVLAEAGAIAGLLLTAAPGLSVLATSRERLGVEGEHAWPLPPLEHGGDAVALFAERARAADPEFRLDDDSRPVVERICLRLGGQPLAIELAAALTIALSVGDIERHLDGRLLDAGGGRLRAAVELSWDALDGGAATLLRRLAVCSEGFDLEMVEALGNDLPSPIGALEQLVGRSLVSTERRAGHLRYFLLETIRWFAADRLDASGDGDARSTHAREMTRRAGAWFREWLGGGLPWRALTRDAGNLRAAAGWAAGHDIALLQELAGFLGPLWEPLGAGDEGYRRTMEALAAGEPEDPESRARLLLAAVCTAPRAGEVRAALGRADDIVEGFRASGNLHGMARALRLFGQSGEFFSVEGFADARRRAVEIATETGDRRLLAGSTDDYAWERWQAGDPEAVEQWRRAADLYRDLGDDASWAAAAAVRITAEHYLTDAAEIDPIDELLRLQEVVAGLGASFSTSQIENELRIASEALGRLDDAIAHGRRAVEIADTIGDERWRALCTIDLADLYRQTGDFAEAAAHLLDGAAHFRANERPGSCIWVVETIVQLLADTGDHEEAARLAGAAQRLRDDHRLPMPVWDAVTYRVAIDALRRSLGPGEFDRLAEEGAGLPLLDALDRATRRVRRILR
jgi:predicted ATPase